MCAIIMSLLVWVQLISVQLSSIINKIMKTSSIDVSEAPSIVFSVCLLIDYLGLTRKGKELYAC